MALTITYGFPVAVPIALESCGIWISGLQARGCPHLVPDGTKLRRGLGWREDPE